MNITRYVQHASWIDRIGCHRDPDYNGDVLLIAGEDLDYRQHSTIEGEPGPTNFVVKISAREAVALRDSLIAMELPEETA